ncbi:cytochrome b562 family protein [Vibrio sp. D404a]|uniref:cytochrome b562 n=1 Tax=unclassified Vibrio TaxID=2614977 RepID=UPI0025544712|nr:MULTISPECIES: cytochrome b562 [unclassified Vibrio]MDK9737354.1 cytochrome b562 family protein [Vibrio sp. D404a]MDK9797970.1 cytochrome b562 family protein [Vibrio sp. D449a]
MKTRSILLSGLIAASVMSASAFANVDLKENMQEMKLAFKQAAEAQSIEEMQKPMVRLDTLVAELKTGSYPAEKEQNFMEGFSKIQASIDSIEQKLEQGQFEEAQQELRTIDGLREQYHEKRNPSIWSKLFG